MPNSCPPMARVVVGGGGAPAGALLSRQDFGNIYMYWGRDMAGVIRERRDQDATR